MAEENDVLVLIVSLAKFKRREEIVAGYIKGINEIFCPSSFDYFESFPSDGHVSYEIKTDRSHFGFIVLKDGKSPDGNCQKIIDDSLRFLPIILEQAADGHGDTLAEESPVSPSIKKDTEPDPVITELKATRSALINLVEDLSDEIDRRKSAEASLQKTERYFRSLIEKAADGIVLVGKDGKMKYASPTAKTIFGYDPDDDVLPDPDLWTYHEDLPRVYEVLDRIIKDPQLILNIEYRFRKKDNSYKWIESTFTNLFEDDSINAIVINFRDITERKEIESALIKSQELYRLVSENGSDVVWLYDLATNRFSYVSPSVSQLRGYTVEEVLHQDMEESMTPESFKMVASDLPGRLASFSGGDDSVRIQTHQIIQNRKDGTTIPTEVVTTLIADNNRNITHIQGVTRDISERKKAEAIFYQRMELQDQLAKIAVTVPGMIYSFRLRPDGTASMPFSTPAMEDIWGFRPDELKDDFSPAFARLHPDDASQCIENIRESARTMTPWKSTFRIIHPVKGEKWLEGSAMPSAEPEGSVIWHGFVQDITERKKIEIDMERSEKRYRELVQNANSAIIRWSGDGRILFFNEFAQKLFGYSVSEVLGKDIGMLVPATDSTGHDLSGIVIDIVEKPDSYVNQINENICSDGRRIWMAWTNKAIIDDSGKVIEILAVGLDITKRKKAEDALQASRSELNAALESMTDAVFISDTEGRFIDFNEAFAAFHKFGNKDECARTLAEYPDILEVCFADGEPAPLDQWAVSRALRGEIVTNAEYRLTRKDTGEKWVGSYSFAPITDKNGKITGSVVVGRDITEIKTAEEQLRESEQRFSSIFRSTPVGINIFRLKDGVCVDLNGAYLKMIGYEYEEVVGHTAQDLNLMVDWSARGQWFESLKARVPVSNQDSEIRCKNGDIINVLISVDVIDIKGEPMGLAIISDITDRIKAEEAIRQLNEDLEKRVTERTSQLETALKELEAFSYSVSHDLRAPLRAVHSYTRILREEYDKSFDDEGKRLCDIIENSAVHMGQLIDDLLAFSRAGRTELNRAGIDLASMAESVFNELVTERERARITFRVNQLPPVTGDSTTIKLVMTNLISNAIKYSSKAQSPVIEIGSAQNNGETVFFIRDNGVGFNMEYAHKLFGVFQRLHSSKEFEGNGVGLAIVNRIIGRHGGQVWAEGEIGKGAAFYFTLPQNNHHEEEGKNQP